MKRLSTLRAFCGLAAIFLLAPGCDAIPINLPQSDSGTTKDVAITMDAGTTSDGGMSWPDSFGYSDLSPSADAVGGGDGGTMTDGAPADGLLDALADGAADATADGSGDGGWDMLGEGWLQDMELDAVTDQAVSDTEPADAQAD